MPKDISVYGGDPEGNYFSPIVLEDIPLNSIAYKEEFFGPVFSLYKATSDEHAIELANDSDYGLGASVFSSDLERAERMARNIDSGMVWVNEFVMSAHDVPWGGFKDSGHGRECHTDGTIENSTRKSIVLERQDKDGGDYWYHK